jgi:hypothetical protein
MTGEVGDLGSVTVRVTLRRVGSSGLAVETDPPGLVPPGMDVETAFMRLGSEMLTALAAVPVPDHGPVRFGRPRRGVREGS